MLRPKSLLNALRSHVRRNREAARRRGQRHLAGVPGVLGAPPESVVHPKWAPAPAAAQRERTFPKLGWPRRTDSLCPECVKEVRAAVLAGDVSIEELVQGNPGRFPHRSSSETAGW